MTAYHFWAKNDPFAPKRNLFTETINILFMQFSWSLSLWKIFKNSFEQVQISEDLLFVGPKLPNGLKKDFLLKRKSHSWYSYCSPSLYKIWRISFEQLSRKLKICQILKIALQKLFCLNSELTFEKMDPRVPVLVSQGRQHCVDLTGKITEHNRNIS